MFYFWTKYCFVFFICINLVIIPDVTELFLCKHWWVKVKKMGSYWEKKYFYLQLSRMLRMILQFTSDCRLYLQDIFFCLNPFIFEERFWFFLGLEFLGWRPILPLVVWPYRRDRTGGLWAMCSVLSLFFSSSSFSLLLFIDRFIVLSFGMGLETKQDWFNIKERRMNEKLKYIK